MHECNELAIEVGHLLAAEGLILVTAESCTGGGIAEAVTSVPGSSTWFECGFVTYTNQSKTNLLGVASSLLEHYGAVSEACVMAMAQGALQHSTADWAIAASGIAGPSGGSIAKPVGTVCFAWCRRADKNGKHEGFIDSQTCLFAGDRASIRAASIEFALNKLKCHLRDQRSIYYCTTENLNHSKATNGIEK